MDYVAKHQHALDRLRDAGTPASFKWEVPGEYHPENDTQDPPTISYINGRAAEIPGDPEEYAALELISYQTVTLMFVPIVMGDTPILGSTIFWRGALRTIKHHFPIAPAEILIADRVILQ